MGTAEEILAQPADAYVAEVVQDVDQGRVIDVESVMEAPAIVDPNSPLVEAVNSLGGRKGGFCVDQDGKPVSLLHLGEASSALAQGSTDLKDVLRTDFESTTA